MTVNSRDKRACKLSHWDNRRSSNNRKFAWLSSYLSGDVAEHFVCRIFLQHLRPFHLHRQSGVGTGAPRHASSSTQVEFRLRLHSPKEARSIPIHRIGSENSRTCYFAVIRLLTWTPEPPRTCCSDDLRSNSTVLVFLTKVGVAGERHAARQLDTYGKTSHCAGDCRFRRPENSEAALPALAPAKNAKYAQDSEDQHSNGSDIKKRLHRAL